MMKVCTKCKTAKPATTEYFCFSSYQKSGLSPRCKECDKQYREKNIDRAKAYNAKYINENRDDFLAAKKKYYYANREKTRMSSKKWREDNKEKIARSKKQYANDHKDELNEYHKNYAIQNRSKIRAIKSKWKKNNKEAVLLNTQTRLAKKRSLLATLTTEQWETINTVFDRKCAYCGKERELEQDHFIALSNGGEYTHNNIIPSCKSCNSSKNNGDFFEWYPKQKFYSKRREQKILNFLNYKNGRQQLSFAMEEGIWTSE